MLRMNMAKIHSASIIILFLLLIPAGCSDPFREAAERDTAESWRAYLNAGYGGEAELEHARRRYDQRMWEEARSLDNIAAYRRYLEAVPQGNFSSSAVKRLDELRFIRAMETGSISALENYLSGHPRGESALLAGARLREMRYEETVKEDSLEAYELFLQYYPDSPETRKARRRLDEIRFQKALEEGSLNAAERYGLPNMEGDIGVDAEVHVRGLKIRGRILAGEMEKARRIIEESGNPVREKLEEVFFRASMEYAVLTLDIEKLEEMGENEKHRELSDNALDIAARLAEIPDINELRIAIQRLSQRDTGLPDPVIIAGLKDGDSRRRRVSARALGFAFHPDVLDLLITALRDRDPGIRAEAALAILRLGNSLLPVVRDVYFTEALESLEGMAAAPIMVWVAAVLLEGAGIENRAIDAYRRASESPDKIISRMRLAYLETDIFRRNVALTGAAYLLRDAILMRNPALLDMEVSDEGEVLKDNIIIRRYCALLELLEMTVHFAKKQENYESQFVWIPDMKEHLINSHKILSDVKARYRISDPEWIDCNLDEASRDNAGEERAEAVRLIAGYLENIGELRIILERSLASPFEEEAFAASEALGISYNKETLFFPLTDSRE